MSVNLEGFVKPYRGKHDDWDVFWSKFTVLASLSGCSSDDEIMKRLPLFLDGDAFLIYSKMSDTDKKDVDKVKTTMMKSFGVSKSIAYSQFTSRRLRVDESVDAFVADLRRLLTLSGHNDVGEKDSVIIEQILAGLPQGTAIQVRLAFAGKEMTISGCSDAIRAIVVVQSAASAPVNVSAAAAVVCHQCNEPGHIRRNCPKRGGGQRGGDYYSSRGGGYSSRGGGGASQMGGSAFGGQRRELRCYFCEQKGHKQNEFQARKQWLASRNAVGAVSAAPSMNADRCLCVAGNSTGGALPRVFIDVTLPGSRTSWKRCKAVIDTGSMQTLVSSALLKDLGGSLSDVTDSERGIVALDGQPLPVLGTVDLQFQRSDRSVSIPCVSLKALVLPDLSVVGTDVLLGSNFSSVCGGLQLQYDSGGVLSGVVMGRLASPVLEPAVRPDSNVSAAASVRGPATDGAARPKLSRHVEVIEEGDNVTLRVDDGEIKWLADEHRWMATWNWLGGQEPQSTIGSNIGEYSRKQLSEDQEMKFCTAVDEWVSNGWLVEYDQQLYGKPACVLPLMAVVQEHKATTPVRPVLDYRKLNELVASNPGLQSPVCEDTLRKWRKKGEQEYELIDIRKAYLQVHVSPELFRFQTVKWRGKLYAMTRMGFGLSVAPKYMDLVVKYVTRDMPDVDNYVDDLMVPKAQKEAVVARLADFALPTKPAELLVSARVLGLQLSDDGDGVMWTRREDASVDLPDTLTKRDVFSWCGKVISHYPVASWLRPACGYLKRLACIGDTGWDSPVSDDVVSCCADVLYRLHQEDPVCGVWSVDSSPKAVWTIWCDASDIAIATVAEVSGCVVEDRSWLRSTKDKKHINVAELESLIKGIELACDWKATLVHLKTDSKTVYGWVSSVINDVQRVKVNGLYSLLVERRLSIIEDAISAAGLSVTIEWVPSAANKADQLSRVPKFFIDCYKRKLAAINETPAVVAAASSLAVVGPVSVDQICEAQLQCPVVVSVMNDLKEGCPVAAEQFKKVRTQLMMVDGMLYRSVKLPVHGVVTVPVIPVSLQADVLRAAHVNAGHSSWDSMYEMIRSRCYFPNVAVACQQYVSECVNCAAANPRSGPVPSSTRADVPGRPWTEVTIDVLELGDDRSSKFHCVLVAIDNFTKWVEVTPLRRHDAISVADAFTEMCKRWGAPEVVRMDNGTEFRNAIMDSVFQLMGISVRNGAVRHAQSQGSAERANRTILGLIRKVLESSSDWSSDLSVLLFYYRIRVHSATKISPMMAMVGWQPQHLIVQSDPSTKSLSQWSEQLEKSTARIRDLVEQELSSADSIDEVAMCAYGVGDGVLLQQPSRRQKRMPPYEAGWRVLKVVSGSTVVIGKCGRQDKVVNVQSIKLNPAPSLPAADVAADTTELEVQPHDDQAEYAVELEPLAAPASPPYGLRNRGALSVPARYQD